jgi:hypothetical protein
MKHIFYRTSDGDIINVTDIAYLYKYYDDISNKYVYSLWFKNSMSQFAKTIDITEKDYKNINSIIEYEHDCVVYDYYNF